MKEEIKMENNELNQNEMEQVVGGKRHFKPEKDRKGWLQHKVEKNDTLIKIAKAYDIPNWRMIRDWNPHIDPVTNLIMDGEYLWIKVM